MLKSLKLFTRLSFRREISTSGTMSHSKYEYVRKYEADDRLLPDCWIVVRIDGKAFHKFSEKHEFVKPNDKRALDLVTVLSYIINLGQACVRVSSHDK